MDDLGVMEEELQKKDKADFEKKGLDHDVIELRYKHYQARLIDTINRVVEQRREIKIMELRNANRNLSKTPHENSKMVGSQQQQKPLGI